MPACGSAWRRFYMCRLMFSQELGGGEMNLQ
jgi:hypothetical protein